jgi:hypothetical protein
MKIKSYMLVVKWNLLDAMIHYVCWKHLQLSRYCNLLVHRSQGVGRLLHPLIKLCKLIIHAWKFSLKSLKSKVQEFYEISTLINNNFFFKSIGTDFNFLKFQHLKNIYICQIWKGIMVTCCFVIHCLVGE